MTDKRFILDDPEDYRSTCGNIDKRINGFALVENEPPYHTFYLEEVVDLLNEQHETIEQLKSEIKDLNDVLARYEEKELEMGLL